MIRGSKIILIYLQLRITLEKEPQFIHCGHLLNYRCYQKQHLSACEERIAEQAGYVGALCLHRQTHAPAHSLELSKVVEAFLAKTCVTIVSKQKIRLQNIRMNHFSY